MALVAVIPIISTCFAFFANLDYMTLSHKLVSHCRRMVEQDSSACIATRYGLDVSGIESRLVRDLGHPSRLALRSTQPLIHEAPGVSQG
jgi:hypothetical protein